MQNIWRRLILSVVLLLVGCAQAMPNADPTATVVEPTAVTVMPTATVVAPVTTSVVDGAGRTVQIPAMVERIVSLAPSTTEIVYALGKGDAIVAVDMFSDYPAQVSALPKISNPDMSYNYEQITTLQPDVVFAAAITSPDAVASLEKLNIPVIVVGSFTITMTSVQSDITLVCEVLGVQSDAKALTTQMQQGWDAIAAKVKDSPTTPTVFWELDATDPSKPYTVGKGSFITDMMVTAGAKNVFADVDNPYPQVSIQQVIALWKYGCCF